MKNGGLGPHGVYIRARCSDLFFYSQAMFNHVDVAYLAIELHPTLHYLQCASLVNSGLRITQCKCKKTPKPRKTQAIVRKNNNKQRLEKPRSLNASSI
jgi:hypothetical protein